MYTMQSIKDYLEDFFRWRYLTNTSGLVTMNFQRNMKLVIFRHHCEDNVLTENIYLYKLNQRGPVMHQLSSHYRLLSGNSGSLIMEQIC